jgi:hypothetical protein
VVDGQERLQAGTPVEVHNVSPSGPGAGSAGSAPAPSKDSDPSSAPKKKMQGKKS